jgi:23S rRNA (uracil1939-C5)-methyltransferase
VSVTLDILEVGQRGDGVAVEQGRRYFVPFALPGEVVVAKPLGKRGDGTLAELEEVLAPSAYRETPPCAHFGSCGGCALQHWRHDACSAWKGQLIERALKQRGVDAPAFEPMLVGQPAERRRVDFVARRQGKRTIAGFHERASERVVDVGSCVVARPTLNALLAPLRDALAPILTEGRAADVIVNETDGGLDVLIRPQRPIELGLESRQALVAFAERADLARLSWGPRDEPEPLVTRRPPVLFLDDAVVEVPPGAFLQATRRAEQAMRAAVAAWTAGAGWLADLFAGIGTLSLGGPGRVHLFDGDSAAIAAVAAAARKLGTARIVAGRRDLYRHPLMAGELERFDAALLDPPRTGAAAQSLELARSRVPRIVYASCDPGSFARDARTLQEGGYRLEKLLPIDQFLWSVHVELIALFVK